MKTKIVDILKIAGVILLTVNLWFCFYIYVCKVSEYRAEEYKNLTEQLGDMYTVYTDESFSPQNGIQCSFRDGCVNPYYISKISYTYEGPHNLYGKESRNAVKCKTAEIFRIISNKWMTEDMLKNPDKYMQEVVDSINATPDVMCGSFKFHINHVGFSCDKLLTAKIQERADEVNNKK